MNHTMRDCFYTPPKIADILATSLPEGPVGSCMDSACGDGMLLAAVQRLHPEVTCFGIDINEDTIVHLKSMHPEWILSVGDFLSEESRSDSIAVRLAEGCDVIVSNPPFSMGCDKKGIHLRLNDSTLRCSVAMAHILTNIYSFRPRLGMSAIVPESMLFSEFDRDARALLSREYSVEVLGSLNKRAFIGGNANSILIRITYGPNGKNGVKSQSSHSISEWTRCIVTRGGLPVCQSKWSSNGVLYLHTTGLADYLNNCSETNGRVQPLNRGVVRGPTVLIPRVGLPITRFLRAKLIEEPVQLSDCLIALVFERMSEASSCVDLMRNTQFRFVENYHGTGARYVTLRRLCEWLEWVGIKPSVKQNALSGLCTAGTMHNEV